MSRQIKQRVTVLPGDGIGPEVMLAAQRVMEAAGASLGWDVCQAGGVAFRQGCASGVPQETIESIRRNRVVLKGPLETPIGFGEKSANVTLRKLFETYGNVRPVRELPGVDTPYRGRGIDLVIVRENVEDLYAGIEHQQTESVAQCLKLMSRLGCEKIVRLAFEVARAEGRRTVHCATKANIMKLTEGLLKRTFEEVAREYPDISAKHIIIDNCAHELVRRPEHFEIIVTSNMNGDILSDLTAGLVGGLGLAASANIGSDVAIFEAVHGSAPNLADQDLANPSALIFASVLMLRHLGEEAIATKIENAVLCALEEGKQTIDIKGPGALGTRAFTEAVIERLGRAPRQLAASRTRGKLVVPPSIVEAKRTPSARRPIGVDVFIEARLPAQWIGGALESLVEASPFRLKLISNRGTMVYPINDVSTDCVDHWRCRFVLKDGTALVKDAQILELLATIGRHYRWMHVEKLEEIDGARGYTQAQGED